MKLKFKLKILKISDIKIQNFRGDLVECLPIRRYINGGRFKNITSTSRININKMYKFCIYLDFKKSDLPNSGLSYLDHYIIKVNYNSSIIIVLFDRKNEFLKILKQLRTDNYNLYRIKKDEKGGVYSFSFSKTQLII